MAAPTATLPPLSFVDPPAWCDPHRRHRWPTPEWLENALGLAPWQPPQRQQGGEPAGLAVLADFLERVDAQYPTTIENEELSELLTTINSQEKQIATLENEVKNADVVLDCSDNFATRFAINAACVRQKTPLVSGSGPSGGLTYRATNAPTALSGKGNHTVWPLPGATGIGWASRFSIDVNRTS